MSSCKACATATAAGGAASEFPGGAWLSFAREPGAQHDTEHRFLVFDRQHLHVPLGPAARRGCAADRRPISMASIRCPRHHGGDGQIPFSTKPIKARYMWRDVERRAALYGIPWSSIPPYPIKHLSFANRTALVGAREGWCAEYVKTAHRRWFAEGQDPSLEPNIATALREIGQSADRVLGLAASEQIKAALQSETNTARALGIFGAPTFVSGEEIFWGDDRLEDAIRWHRQAAPAEKPA